MSNDPMRAFQAHHDHIVEAVEMVGYLTTARESGVPKTTVIRYCKGDHAVYAHVHYLLAHWAGVQLQLPLTPAKRRRNTA